MLTDIIKNAESEFDKEFVIDMGEEVEPILKDPTGSVGPIKQFFTQQIENAVKKAFEETKVIPKEDTSMEGIENSQDYGIAFNQALTQVEKAQKEYLNGH